MSQVIVTKDKFSAARKATAAQESAISKEDQFDKWRISDISKPNPIMKVLGLAFLPIVLAWTGLLAGVGFALSIVVFLLKGLSKIFR